MGLGIKAVKCGVKNLLHMVTGRRIPTNLPHGFDLRLDLRNRLPGYSVETLIDVGANIGQSAMAYLESFPGCRIFCLEPIASTFEQLRTNLGGVANVHCFQVALGAERRRGRMVFFPEGFSQLSYLLCDHDESRLPAGAHLEEVEIDTLTDFCRRHQIERVSLVKIDTEGHDLEVLKGATYMLEEHRVDLVQVEAGMNRENRRHVPLEALKTFLEERGYYLFGLYEQVSEWPAGEPHLRRSNLVFLSRKVIQTYRRTRVESRSQ